MRWSSVSSVLAAALLAAPAFAAPKKSAPAPEKKPAEAAAPAPAAPPANDPPIATPPKAPKSLGVVSLKVPDIDKNVERQANAQLRATLAAIAHLPLAEVTLPADTPPTNPAKLRNYAVSTDLDRVVGGEIVTTETDRVVHLVSVSTDGRSPIHVQRKVRDLSQEELVAAIEGAACEAAADAGKGEDCQGSISVDGDAKDADLKVDGALVGKLPLITDIPAAVGAHDVALEKGGDTSAQSRVYVHLKSTVKLEVAEVCGSLYFLQPGQQPECKPPTIVVVPDAEIPTSRWVGIGTAAAGAAGIVVGAVFGTQANKAKSDFTAAYDNGGASSAEASRLLTSMKTNASRANVLVGAGAALTALGAGLIAFSF